MVELFKEEVRVLGAEDHLISCDLRFNPDLRSMPVVLFCHGFKGFKDWGPWNLVADRFAEAGIFFIKMNFSHNGVHPDNLLDITDPESFGQNSISKELADIKAVVDWFVNDNEIYKPYVDEENISIIGHSRGAATSIISILENDKLRNVICWSGAYNLEKFLNLIPDEKWKLDGKTEVINGRTGQSYPLYYQLKQDYLDNKERFDLTKRLAELDQNLLLIHGENDAVAPISNSRKIHQFVSHSILITNDGDHTFNSKHPWNEATLSPQLDMAVSETIDFIKLM